jgi:hypothetical protein
MTPYELRALGELRKRGKAPQLAVFIVDDWAWGDMITNEIGVLAIKVRNARDYQHDWAPLAGLWAYLKLRRCSASDLADFSAALLAANPAKLTVWVGDSVHETVWDVDAPKVAA